MESFQGGMQSVHKAWPWHCPAPLWPLHFPSQIPTSGFASSVRDYGAAIPVTGDGATADLCTAYLCSGQPDTDTMASTASRAADPWNQETKEKFER